MGNPGGNARTGTAGNALGGSSSNTATTSITNTGAGTSTCLCHLDFCLTQTYFDSLIIKDSGGMGGFSTSGNAVGGNAAGGSGSGFRNGAGFRNSK